ncbi:MAG: molybdopterin dehydrogenase [Treponema sp. GWB1_62_6]|nr:MAG: molybdopterin dehydrogenase [Treponema sp. GWC1_61_84]OHE68847.1 MAG: molybdopterin dehydrogenase [Treponema sp. GWB1_62_6]HCM28201.1 molybdopterin dehydrogenase [Treponema sp.]
MLHAFKYAAPRSRAEMLDLLAEHGERAKVLAGGTDLLVNIRGGNMKPALVIDAKRVEGYGGLSWDPAEGLTLRPATTINDVLRDKRVRTDFPLLAICGHDLASYQIRNRATVIGNVVNASPCSDMAPALLCFGALAEISSARGTRTVPFTEFFTGVKKTVLAKDEILERIVIPASAAGTKGEYRKLKRINGHDLGIVGVAIARKGGSLRIAVSSAAPVPVLVTGLSAGSTVDEAVAATLAAVNPISDVRCTKEYRLFMIETFVRRLMEEMK